MDYLTNQMSESKYLPTKLVHNPYSPFPDYIDFKIDETIVRQLKELINKYTTQTYPASIYSFTEKKVVQSNTRSSEKKSFKDDDIANLCETFINPLVKNLLESTYSLNEYDITIGSQHFDYIKYESGGYFEPHQDFTRINSSQHQQYTVIIGLSQITSYHSGNTILWLPVNSTNILDWEDLSNPSTNSSCLYSKYKIPSWYSKSDIIRVLESINYLSLEKYLPLFFPTLQLTNILAFKSSMVHSGETFISKDLTKELLVITLNISCVEKNTLTRPNIDLTKHILVFDKYIQDSSLNNYIPFQIILCSGEYNGKKFSDKYLKFWNLDSSIHKPTNPTITQGISKALEEIYQQTKSKLNHRGRESLLESNVESSESNMDSLEYLGSLTLNQQTDSDKLDFINQHINNFFLNFNFKNNCAGTYQEKITNRWEESGCNDSGDEYDELTYLTCNIDIKFGFCQNN